MSLRAAGAAIPRNKVRHIERKRNIPRLKRYSIYLRTYSVGFFTSFRMTCKKVRHIERKRNIPPNYRNTHYTVFASSSEANSREGELLHFLSPIGTSCHFAYAADAPLLSLSRHFPRFSGGIYPQGGSETTRHSERSEESHRRTDEHILYHFSRGIFRLRSI